MSINSSPKPLIVVLTGPTGVGKTEILLKLFENSGEIINADSMQVYKGLDAGTAKPGADMRMRLTHHLLDTVNPDRQFHAGTFVKETERLIEEISSRNKIPVISGGTAFYLRSFLYGLSSAPPGTQELRAELERELETEGPGELYQELQRVDPASAGRIAPGDTYRIIRALEVYRSSGRPLSSFKVPKKLRQDYNLLLIGLNRERNELYGRIDTRVERMFEAGLVDEVSRLIEAGYRKEDPGMRGIGYKEFFFMRRTGYLLFADLKELIKRNTRRYAKRQLTFMRKFPGIKWFHPDDLRELRKTIELKNAEASGQGDA